MNAPAGHFYAWECSHRLGLGATGGLRMGLAPYTNASDIDRLARGLEEICGTGAMSRPVPVPAGPGPGVGLGLPAPTRRRAQRRARRGAPGRERHREHPRGAAACSRRATRRRTTCPSTPSCRAPSCRSRAARCASGRGAPPTSTSSAAGRRAARAAWHYPTPVPAYAVLSGHVAVMPGLVDACFVDGERVRPQEGGFYGGWITDRVVGPFKGGPGSWGW